MFRVVHAIAKVTFWEIIRDRVLYNIVLGSLALFGLGFLASSLAVYIQDRVILDFGWSTVSISCSVIAALVGASMLPREYERRTAWVAFSRPISAFQFVFGKFAGLGAVLFLNWLLMLGSYVLVLFLTSGRPALAMLGSTFAWAMLFAYLQSLLIGAFAVMFSSFSTTSLSVIFTAGTYLIGTNISQLQYLAARIKAPAAASLFKAAVGVLPDLEHFNVGFKLTYDLPITWKFGLTSIVYAALLSGLALTIGGVFTKRRET